MSLLKNTIAVLLAIIFLNIIVSKSLHEIFEHKHVEHTCDVDIKDITHFHKSVYAHIDFLCSFNLNSVDYVVFKSSLKDQLYSYQNKVNILYLWLVKNLYYDLNLQRGPPFNS